MSEVLVDRGDHAVIIRPTQPNRQGEVNLRRTPSGVIIDGGWDSLAEYEGIVELLSSRPAAYKPYRDVLELLGGRVPEGEPVEDGFPIAIIGIKNFSERHLMLREKDRMPLPRVRAAGKSAHVAVTTDVRVVLPIVMGTPRIKDDRLFVVPAWAIREAGFEPVHAPTGGKRPPYRHPLHVRIIPRPEVYDENGDIPIAGRERLANVIGQYLMPDPDAALRVQRKRAHGRSV
jgi:hypothetical protein